MSIHENQKSVVLAIGGLDPSGGAGISMDALAVNAAGAHPACIAAVLTRQTGRRFVARHTTPSAEIEETARLIMAELNVQAVKVGALGSRENVLAVARLARETDAPPIIMDPVIKSTSGGTLLSDEAVEAIKTSLLGHLRLITPNIPEAEILTGSTIGNAEEMVEAAQALRGLGAGAVLLKGGHLEGEDAVDIFIDNNGKAHRFESRRTVRHDVRGTGCALASLIAGSVAEGNDLPAAITHARETLQNAIRRSTLIGPGNWVLNFDVAPTRRPPRRL